MALDHSFAPLTPQTSSHPCQQPQCLGSSYEIVLFDSYTKFLKNRTYMVTCLSERQASACSRPGAESRFSKSTIAVLFDTVILETSAANGYGMISMFEQIVGATPHTTKVPSITSNYYLLPVLSSTTKPFPLECNKFLSSASAHPPKNYVFCQNKKNNDILLVLP